MSKETALHFLARVEREESLRSQLYVSNPSSMTKMLQFARGKGFLITETELREALDEYKEQYATGTIKPLKELVASWPVTHDALPEHELPESKLLPPPGLPATDEA